MSESQMMDGFTGAIFQEQGCDEFRIHFHAKTITHNGQPLNVAATQLEVKRKRWGDDFFVEIELDLTEKIFIQFWCSITLTRVSPTMIEVTVDNGRPYAISLDIVNLKCAGQTIDFQKEGTFTYIRSSGEDDNSLIMTVGKNLLRVWFITTLDINVLPILHPTIARMLGSAELFTIIAHSRMEAYGYQQMGFVAVKDEPGRPEWETIILTPEEDARASAKTKAMRQKAFEDHCGCS